MTQKQIDFCEYYMEQNFSNITLAAIKAGYSKKTAKSIGSENLTKPEIKKYLSTKIKRMLTSRDNKALKLLNIIEHAANFDIRDVIEWSEIEDKRTGLKVNNIRLKPSDEINKMDAIMISGISQMRDGSIRLKIVPKEKAWDMLAQFTRLISEDREDDSEDKTMSDEARKERISFLVEKMKKKK